MSTQDENPRDVTAEDIEKWEGERRRSGYLFVVHVIVTLLMLAGCVAGGIYLSSYLSLTLSIGLTLGACLFVVLFHVIITDKIIFKTGK